MHFSFFACKANLYFKGSLHEWRIVFIVTASIYLIGAIPYIIFAKGEVQQWAAANKKSNDELEETKHKFLFN